MTSGAAAEPGLVVVDKAGGMTSHDVVSRVRRLVGTRKVGHAGTLDPMATGVLVLGVGRATRLLGHLTTTEKAYEATVRLGAATTTDDAEGEVLTTASTQGLDEAQVRTALGSFVGEIQQVPAAVSAVKVDGRRAYERVRAGEDVELTARTVTIHEIEVLAVCLPEVHLRMRCSSGTYVRALARDLGELLGVGGHLATLRRTRVGGFTLDHAVSLEELAERPRVLPIADAARAAFPAVELDEGRAADVRVGRGLQLPLDRLSALFDTDGAFLALYEPRAGGVARPVAVFV